MYRIVLTVVLCLMACLGASAASAADNARLVAIFKEDQQVRQQPSVDWDTVAAQDKAHRAEVLALLRAGELHTSADYFHAAMVFQHGETLDDYRLAFSLAQLSAALDPGNKPARWLSAASWDRMLMSKNVPQWYGTQYHQPRPDAPTELYKVDESVVTDAERAAMNVPSLQVAKDLLKEINK